MENIKSRTVEFSNRQDAYDQIGHRMFAKWDRDDFIQEVIRGIKTIMRTEIDLPPGHDQ